MPDQNWLHLNFDVYERLHALAQVLNEVAPQGPVLDVGGHPGLLKQMLPQRHITTVDFPPVGEKPYVQASGGALPFRSSAFRVALCSDTLEHVPPQHRGRFLGEMARVTSDAVIVGGPFATPVALAAESALRDVETALEVAKNPWLLEHEECGLPDLQQTLQRLRDSGFQNSDSIASGDAVSWLGMFALQLLLQDVAGGDEALKNFMPFYNELFSGDDSDGSYRQIIVAQRAATGNFGRGTVKDVNSEARTLRKIEALRELTVSVARGLRKISSAGAQVLESAYIEQLEKALALQAKTLERLEVSPRPSRMQLLKQLMGL